MLLLSDYRYVQKIELKQLIHVIENDGSTILWKIYTLLYIRSINCELYHFLNKKRVTETYISQFFKVLVYSIRNKFYLFVILFYCVQSSFVIQISEK